MPVAVPMTMRPAVLLVTLLLAAAVAPFPGSPAQASCVGPQLSITGQRARLPEVRPAIAVTVDGRYFVNGCDDTGGQATGFGCAHRTRPQDRVTPMAHVELVLRQHGREWRLGTAEATSDGRISWDVRVPVGVEPGRARLMTPASDTLVVVVPRR
jgi:hypothetical protein